MVLGVLPFIGLLLCIWMFAGPLGEGSWRRGALRAAVLWGLYSILSLELLSLFSAVTRPILLAIWLVPVVSLLGLKAVELNRAGKSYWSLEWLPQGVLGKILAFSLLAVLLITALVAWLTPPNTWDSLNYHMPRVAHWAQLQAVRHFATGIEIQNSMPPASEMMILHSYVLAQGDRWANFVAWGAVWLSVLGVSIIAKQLGANMRGQLFAAVFAASLPTAIIQASSTMTDALVGLWMIVVANEIIALIVEKRFRLRTALFVSAAAGLAALTKPIAYAYLLPFAIFIAIWLVRFSRWRRLFILGGLGLVVFVGINFGHWSRNFSLYDNPISQASRIQEHGSPWLGGRAFASNLVRNVAMHAGTPSPHLNKGITLLVQEFHQLLDLDVNDPRTTATGIFKIRWGETNEDKATNPLHGYLLVGLLAAACFRRDQWTKVRLEYLLLSAATLLAFSLLFQWQLYAGRYHLPFFWLMAPIFGWQVSAWFDWDGWPLLAIGLITLSWPWLLQIKSKPILPANEESYVGSILITPRDQLYLANSDYLTDPLFRFREVLDEASCQRVGLRLGGGAPEYLWWVWLSDMAARPDIQWVVEGTPSAKLGDETELTCALICQDCRRDRRYYGDMLLVEYRRGFSLFLDGQASPR